MEGRENPLRRPLLRYWGAAFLFLLFPLVGTTALAFSYLEGDALLMAPFSLRVLMLHGEELLSWGVMGMLLLYSVLALLPVYRKGTPWWTIPGDLYLLLDTFLPFLPLEGADQLPLDGRLALFWCYRAILLLALLLRWALYARLAVLARSARK